MTAILDKHKLTYVSVPKVACTSLKSLFFEVENGVPFQSFRVEGKPWHIHRLYKGRLFTALPDRRIADHTRLTVVRDPVRRVLSCYSNRVIHHRELSPKQAGAKLAKAGLPTNPDLATFIDRQAEYRRAVQKIHGHARPMVDNLGSDPAWFTRVYRFDELSVFAEDVCRHTGAKAELRRMQTGGPKIDPADLTPQQAAKIRDYYAADYEAFGHYF